MAEDGQSLDIRDNHPPDASVAPAVDAEFVEEPSSEDQSGNKH